MRQRSDGEIRHDVGIALGDAAVDAMAITVTIHQGTVHLRGEVASHSERLAVMALARSTAAPARVRSELTVAPVGLDFSLTDGDVAVEVARALVQSDIPPGSISFDVHDHVVTLNGSAESAELRTRVRHIVQAARGVDFIDNRIVVTAVGSTKY